MLDFKAVKINSDFYIATTILILPKSLILNLNLADAIFGNTTVISTLKSEIWYTL